MKSNEALTSSVFTVNHCCLNMMLGFIPNTPAHMFPWLGEPQAGFYVKSLKIKRFSETPSPRTSPTPPRRIHVHPLISPLSSLATHCLLYSPHCLAFTALPTPFPHLHSLGAPLRWILSPLNRFLDAKTPTLVDASLSTFRLSEVCFCSAVSQSLAHHGRHMLRHLAQFHYPYWKTNKQTNHKLHYFDILGSCFSLYIVVS